MAYEDRLPFQRVPLPKPPVECNGKYPAFEDSLAPQPTTGTRAIGGEGRQEDIGYEMAETTIPTTRLDEMLQELQQVYPHLAQRDRIVGTRVCWYSDTLDENWIIDRLSSHPTLSSSSSSRAKGGENVWVVSGDSGHAYKFLTHDRRPFRHDCRPFAQHARARFDKVHV